MTSLRERVSRLDPRTHLMSRIWLETVIIILTVMLALLALLQLLLQDYFLTKSLDEAAVSTSVAATALQASYSQIMLGFVDICGTEDFEELFKALPSVNKATQTQMNLSLQPTLNDMVRRNSLASSAIMINRDGVCFVPLSHRLQDGEVTMDMGYDPDRFHGVSFLPMMDSPIVGQRMVVPLAFPLTVLPGATKLIVAREVRIMVVPEKIDDAKCTLLARDIKERIENELTYPGQIKVTVIREVRANEIAK